MAVATAISARWPWNHQMLIDFSDGDPAAHIEFMKSYRALLEAWLRFTLAQIDSRPDLWRTTLEISKRQNREPDVMIRAQVFPRPIGMLLGHELSLNPLLLPELCGTCLSFARA